MSEDESEEAYNNMAKRPAKRWKQAKHRISGIFFVNDSTWTVWIDNVPYSSPGQKEDFSIDEVSEDSVTLTMNDGITIDICVNADCDNGSPIQSSHVDAKSPTEIQISESVESPKNNQQKLQDGQIATE
jgi:hypothetical protein